MILNKQNYKRAELNNKLYLIQKDKKDLIYIKNEIIVNIYEDDIYDKIIDIFEKINEDYISIYGSNINELIYFNYYFLPIVSFFLFVFDMLYVYILLIFLGFLLLIFVNNLLHFP